MFFLEIPLFNTNSVDSDQRPHSAVVDLGLHFLLMSLLWVSACLNGLIFRMSKQCGHQIRHHSGKSDITAMASDQDLNHSYR